MTLPERIDALPHRERAILLAILGRLEMGLESYGPWEDRGRNYEREALEEMLDGMAYIAAKLTGDA
ncbi:MAG: hypothetical protein GY851_30380 [bacterium]|nr:hypothetical protein [bacterium]